MERRIIYVQCAFYSASVMGLASGLREGLKKKYKKGTRGSLWGGVRPEDPPGSLLLL